MTSSVTPASTPIVVPSNAVDGGGDTVTRPGSGGVPSSEVIDDGDDDLPVDVAGSLDGLSVDQLVALEAAGNDPSAIAAAIGESGVSAVEGAATEQVAAPASETPGGKGAARLSIRGLSEDDASMTRAAVSAVREGKYSTVIDAMMGLYPDRLQPAAASPVAPAAPAVAPAEVEPLEPSADLLSLRSQVQQLDSEIDEADAVFDTIKSNKLLRQRQDLVLKLDREESRFEQAQAQHQAFEAQVDASTNRALAAWPDLGVEGSPAFSAVEDAIILARAKGDDILSQSDWPEQIAKRTLERLNGNNGAVQNLPAKPAPAAQIPAPLPTGVRMPGSLVGSGAQAAQLNALSAAAELEKMDSDEQIRALELADLRLAGR